MYLLVAMSVPKMCVSILAKINPSDFSVKHRIIYFYVGFYFYSRNGLLSLEFDISSGVYFLVHRYYCQTCSEFLSSWNFNVKLRVDLLIPRILASIK